MSKTPRSDEELYDNGVIDCERGGLVEADFARQLERELAEAKAKLESYSDDCAMMDSLRAELAEAVDTAAMATYYKEKWRQVAEELEKCLRDAHIKWHPQPNALCNYCTALALFNELKGAKP
jgi:hypothetical protein